MMYRNKQRGFTIVELMLAMTFLTMLMLAIAMIAIQIGSIYVKGLTLREVNQTGQQISSDLRKTLSQSINKATTVGDETGGRLCVDNVVYAWNYGEYLGETIGVFNVRQGAAESESTNVRLMKFEKVDGTDYCATQDDGLYPQLPEAAKELLGSGNTNIALHDFTITDNAVEGDSSQTVYVLSILIGTKETGEIQDNDSGACVESNDLESDLCAINRFNFTARSGNKEEQ
jgi:Tfp pilus assembly protein FimT